MEDNYLLDNIHALVEEEHQLRSRITAGGGGSEEDRVRLEHLEERLDQCWDLLRQRRAREHSGADPGDAVPRPVAEVEGYLQ